MQRPRDADAALASLAEYDIDVSRETAQRLLTYYDLLLQWQAKINLVSPTTLPQAWLRHFIDSAQLLPLIGDDVKSLTDIGSGGGFAGLVIALARPDISVTLVESDTRKCAFLQAVARAAGIKVQVSNMRIEKHQWGHVDMVTARALAALPLLCDYIQPAFAANKNAKALFLKGGQWQAEMAEAAVTHPMFHVEHIPSKTESASAILVLSQQETAS